MQIVRELGMYELYLTLKSMLIFPEGEWWCYYWADPEWWELRLYTRRN